MVVKEAPDHLQTTDPSEQIVYYKTRGSLLVAVNRALKKMDDDPNYTVKDKNSPIHGMNRAKLEKVVANTAAPFTAPASERFRTVEENTSTRT